MKPTCLILVFFLAVLSGCAHYQAKPLNSQPTLLGLVPHLVVQAQQMPLPELATHPFNPDDGLDMEEVAILAVVNNSDLKVARDEQGIARAQLIAAGILPNPQWTAGLDHPTSGDSAYVNAFNLGLSYDLGALITRNATLDVARSRIRKIDLALVWQEWQVVQQARLLFVKSLAQGKRMKVLQEYRALFTLRVHQARGALKEGNLTLDALSDTLRRLQEIDSRIHNLRRQTSKTRHDLNALLGLSPEVRFKLVGEPGLPGLDQKKIKTYMTRLPQRRPDLLALQAGYASQEARFRRAILAQFPAMTIGLTQARDTSGVYTAGLGITISLPIFDRNQGPIAIEKATRRRLYDEYQARLNQAVSQITRLLAQINLVTRQGEEVKNDLANLEVVVRPAKEELEAGNIEAATYTNLYTALLDKRLESISLEQTRLEEQVALQTLIGSELPYRYHPIKN